MDDDQGQEKPIEALSSSDGAQDHHLRQDPFPTLQPFRIYRKAQRPLKTIIEIVDKFEDISFSHDCRRGSGTSLVVFKCSKLSDDKQADLGFFYGHGTDRMGYAPSNTPVLKLKEEVFKDDKAQLLGLETKERLGLKVGELLENATALDTRKVIAKIAKTVPDLVSGEHGKLVSGFDILHGFVEVYDEPGKLADKFGVLSSCIVPIKPGNKECIAPLGNDQNELWVDCPPWTGERNALALVTNDILTTTLLMCLFVAAGPAVHRAYCRGLKKEEGFQWEPLEPFFKAQRMESFLKEPWVKAMIAAIEEPEGLHTIESFTELLESFEGAACKL